MADAAPERLDFTVQVPPEHEVGVYANFMAVWNTPHDFTLDFGVTLQAADQGDGSFEIPCRIVARVKLPLTVVEDVLAALARQVQGFEDAAGGKIMKPGENPGQA